MPAKSKEQQRAAGMALSAKRGDMSVSKLKGAAKEMYGSMSEEELEDFASTKHEDIKGGKDKSSWRAGKKAGITPFQYAKKLHAIDGLHVKKVKDFEKRMRKVGYNDDEIEEALGRLSTTVLGAPREHTVTEEVEIMADGCRFLLEKGDKIIVNEESYYGSPAGGTIPSEHTAEEQEDVEEFDALEVGDEFEIEIEHECN